MSEPAPADGGRKPRRAVRRADRPEAIETPAREGFDERWHEATNSALPPGSERVGENDERLKLDKPPHWG